MLVVLLLGAGAAAAAAGSPVRGLPFTRTYSLEDIGYGPRGARLDFDRFGRIVVIHDGVYAVLNDTVWRNIAYLNASMGNVTAGRDGQMYFGGRASWGVAEIGSEGLLHPRSFVPANPPGWVQSASFDTLIPTSDGVYFVSPNGVVFWDSLRRENQFYEYSRIAGAFRVGNRVYVSAFEQPLSYLDPTRRVIVPAGVGELDGTVVVMATNLDESHALIAQLDGRLMVFDGQHLSPWEPQGRYGFSGPVSVLRHLADGHVAVGLTGKGLRIFSPEGELVLTLDSPPYQRVTALANREPGVMWVATEDGIAKIFYSSSLTTFGQQLGLTLGWPIIESWQGTIFVASEGKLYHAAEGPPGMPTRFELYPYQPARGTWALAAWGPRMLVGGPDRVYSVEPDGSLRSVAAVGDVAHLVMFDADHCYAIGRREIALLQWQNGQWVEPAPRIGGVTFPSIVHRANSSVWIELGGQVGRLWLRDGKMQLDVVPNGSWTKAHWVNIGVVDDAVVLSGAEGERRFFDESKGTWCDLPKLRALLARSPYWIARVQEDDTGTIWATHNSGVIRFTRAGADYEMDASTFDLTNERFPVLRVLPGGEVWIFGSQSLYHVEHRPGRERQALPAPVLVSLVDGQGEELLTSDRTADTRFELPYARSRLTFAFFSGSDARRRSPTYEYKLTDHEPWTPLAGSLLSLRGLNEGDYHLQVRTLVSSGVRGPVTTIPFEVLPPWYRTRLAYATYGVLGLVSLLGLVRATSYLERRRRRVLERVVQERTRQLEATMAKLGEETRNAATLAERDRLANEIHDSVQQGLTGAMLQLDSTLKLGMVDTDIRSRLNVVRNMVSYARQEVQHAVWDMESPLLEGTELADALRNLTNFASSGETRVEVFVSGEPLCLDRTTSHNLLRIAQEATTNAFRHANARVITLRLEYSPASVSLTVVDDGVGFQPNEVLRDRIGHLGLRGIRTRVKKLRGRLDIQSSPPGGTSIRVEVPVPTPSDSPHDPEADGQ